MLSHFVNGFKHTRSSDASRWLFMFFAGVIVLQAVDALPAILFRTN